MPNQNTETTNYFVWLFDLLNQNTLRNEEALSTTVEIPLLNLAGSKTLLQALGYDNSQVYPQYPVKGFAAVRRYLADFRVGSDGHFWVLELKSPSEKMDNPQFATQVQDYMEGVNREQGGVPIGVLFNGYEAHVFINPKYKALKSYSNQIHTSVRRASSIDELRLLFQDFQCTSAIPDTLKLARKLVQGHIREEAKIVKGKARVEKVQQLIAAMILCPEREVAAAIIEAMPELSELNVRPEELQTAWQSVVAENEAKLPKRRVNSRLISKSIEDIT